MTAAASALAGIHAGDEVILRWARICRIGKVLRRTPSGRFAVACGNTLYQFNAKGWAIGGSRSWDRPTLEPWTKEAAERILAAEEMDRLIAWLRSCDWRLLPVEALREVVAMVKKGGGA